MTIEEFNDIVKGNKASHYLHTCPRPAGEVELHEYERLEAEKFAMRDLVREVCPATKTYTYETSWQYRDFSSIYQQVLELMPLAQSEGLDPHEIARR